MNFETENLEGHISKYHTSKTFILFFCQIKKEYKK